MIAVVPAKAGTIPQNLIVCGQREAIFERINAVVVGLGLSARHAHPAETTALV
jgi:hypothetical protein